MSLNTQEREFLKGLGTCIEDQRFRYPGYTAAAVNKRLHEIAERPGTAERGALQALADRLGAAQQEVNRLMDKQKETERRLKRVEDWMILQASGVTEHCPSCHQRLPFNPFS